MTFREVYRLDRMADTIGIVGVNRRNQFLMDRGVTCADFARYVKIRIALEIAKCAALIAIILVAREYAPPPIAHVILFVVTVYSVTMTVLGWVDIVADNAADNAEA